MTGSAIWDGSGYIFIIIRVQEAPISCVQLNAQTG